MDFKKEITDTVEISCEQEDINKNRVFAIFAYLFFPVPLIFATKSKFAQFHTKRGIIIFVAGLAISITSTIVSYIPVVKWILGIPLYIIGFIPVAYNVFGIVYSIQGKAKELPFFNRLKFLNDFLGNKAE